MNKCNDGGMGKWEIGINWVQLSLTILFSLFKGGNGSRVKNRKE